MLLKKLLGVFNMAKAKITYKEKAILTAKYSHPKSDDYLEYSTLLAIKDSGKNPIEIRLKFVRFYPFAAPMPPEQHSIKASSILDLCLKVMRWLKNYGYELK